MKATGAKQGWFEYGRSCSIVPTNKRGSQMGLHRTLPAFVAVFGLLLAPLASRAEERKRVPLSKIKGVVVGKVKLKRTHAVEFPSIYGSQRLYAVGLGGSMHVFDDGGNHAVAERGWHKFTGASEFARFTGRTLTMRKGNKTVHLLETIWQYDSQKGVQSGTKVYFACSGKERKCAAFDEFGELMPVDEKN